MIEKLDPRAAIATAMKAFRPLPRAERYGRVSLWTMYYFGALIVPAITTGVRTGRAPATAIDRLDCSRDDKGHVVGFVPRCVGERPGLGHGFGELVDDHLAVVVAECASLAGFPIRVAWSNAAVIIHHAIGEARAADIVHMQALGTAEGLLDGVRHPQLAHPFRSSARRERCVCCLRYLIPDGTLCPGICPRAAP